MIKPNEGLEVRIREYAAMQGSTLVEFLGGGQDGDVWKSTRPSAIKAFHYERTYQAEINAYQRLRYYGVREILEMAVPRLIDWDERLHIVEVDIVTPPYIIDFGKCYLDSPPDYSPEVWQDYHVEQLELLGGTIWGRASDPL
jgi:hypothetical protein